MRKLKARERKWLPHDHTAGYWQLMANLKLEPKLPDFSSTVFSDTPACPLILLTLLVQITEMECFGSRVLLLFFFFNLAP